MESKIELSVVSPVYNAEFFIQDFLDELILNLKDLNISFEIILIEDRSSDQTWLKLKEYAKNTSHLKLVRLSKNFGQHAAIMAGLDHVKGKWIVVMDSDLQDDPSEIKKLYKEAQKGFDLVFARRENRQDSFFKKISSKVFWLIFNVLAKVKYDNRVGNYGIFHHKVISEVRRIGDYLKVFPLFVLIVGFNASSISVQHSKRRHGKSSYSFFKLLSLTFNVLISFSNRPLKLIIFIGFLTSFISFIFGVYTLYRAIFDPIPVLGYSSIIISIWFLSGMIITSIGVTALYIGKIFDQTKGRQSYIIDETYSHED